MKLFKLILFPLLLFIIPARGDEVIKECKATKEITIHEEPKETVPVITLADNREDPYVFRFVIVNAKFPNEYSIIIDRDRHRVYACLNKQKNNIQWNSTSGALVVKDCVEVYQIVIEEEQKKKKKKERNPNLFYKDEDRKEETPKRGP